MKEPPVMLSTKDCMHICDILNVTYVMIKKFRHYDMEVQDVEINELIKNISDALIKQYSSLMEVFNIEK